MQGHELVRGDPVRLTQILANLLNNAARFTPSGGRISISTFRLEGVLVVAVADTGPGLALERQERIFEMFNRGSDSRGLGIGLALSRRLAEMHGGSLVAYSAGVGQGATFELRLPALDMVGQPTPGAVVQKATSSNGHDSHHRQTNASVLVVDDNADAAEATAALLGLMAADVRVAYDGESALASCAVVMPTLMLLDIGMPGIDGYEVSRRLRAMPGGERVVIAALSGWGQPEDRRRGVEAGFDHHLVKPAALEMLEALVQGAASGRTSAH